ncbi:MAG: hypothetical protein WD176_04185, partial [Pirellulales bacterium]
MSPSLDSIDPCEAWQPAPAERWKLKWAAHLYRRAAFGAPPRRETERDATSWELLQRAIAQGRSAAVDELIAGCAGQEPFDELLDGLGRQLAGDDDQRGELQGWWVYRMLHTPHP